MRIPSAVSFVSARPSLAGVKGCYIVRGVESGGSVTEGEGRSSKKLTNDPAGGAVVAPVLLKELVQVLGLVERADRRHLILGHRDAYTHTRAHSLSRAGGRGGYVSVFPSAATFQSNDALDENLLWLRRRKTKFRYIGISEYMNTWCLLRYFLRAVVLKF